MDKELIGQATPEQIAAWKEKYGDIWALKVGDHIAYVKKPDRKTLSYAATIGSKDPVRFNETLLKNCWLGGSDEIKTDDSLFFSASQVLGGVIEVKEAELVKL